MATITLGASRRGQVSLGGVIFTDGVAEGVTLSPNRRAFFEMPAVGATIDEGRDYPGKGSTKAELVAYASENDVDLSQAKNNADRLALIKAHTLPETFTTETSDESRQVREPADVTTVDLPAGADTETVLAAILGS